MCGIDALVGALYSRLLMTGSCVVNASRIDALVGALYPRQTAAMEVQTARMGIDALVGALYPRHEDDPFSRARTHRCARGRFVSTTAELSVQCQLGPGIDALVGALYSRQTECARLHPDRWSIDALVGALYPRLNG